MRVVVDTIRVRGERPRVVRLEYTEHGPILAEDRARGRAFVVRFVGSEPGTAGYLAQLSIDRARDWPSFLEAAARWKVPTENLVYADVDGHIGWIAAGLMPLRGWSGLLPVPGDGRYEWQGMLPPRELPQAYDPPSGMIVTANHNILPPGYPHALNYDWAPPYRAQRIDQVLRGATHLTVNDLERLQLDEYSVPASQLVPVLRAAARRHGAAARSDIAILDRWDFTMRRDQAAPLLYEAWLKALATRLARIEAGVAVDDVSSPLPTLVRLVTAFQPIAARDSSFSRRWTKPSPTSRADSARTDRTGRGAPCTVRPSAIPWPRRSTWETCRGAVMPTPSTPPRARVTSSVGARPIDRSSTSPTGTARSRRACRASRASPAVRTTTTCCRFGRKAGISRSSTPARRSSAKRLTGWCCARRRDEIPRRAARSDPPGEGSPAARPSLDHQMAGAPLRRRAEGGHEHLDLRGLRVGGPAIYADVRRAARATPKGGAV